MPLETLSDALAAILAIETKLGIVASTPPGDGSGLFSDTDGASTWRRGQIADIDELEAALIELGGGPVAHPANTVFAGPTAGADALPTFRALVSGDLPSHAHVIADVTDLQAALDLLAPLTALADLDADNLTSGTIPDARFPSTLPALNGSLLTNLDASNLGSGTVPDARLSSNVAMKAYADALVVGLLDDRGNYDASSNAFPSSGGSGTAGAVLKGDLWTISVAGTLGGSVVTAGDAVRALVDTPGQTAGNWAISENNFGYVAANAGLSNLSGVSINASLIAQTGLNLGAQATPWKELWLYGGGTFGSHSLKLTGTPTGHRVVTFPDASITVARIDAGQTFVGTQVISAIDGGIGANDDITIQGTSNATRTSSYVSLQPNGGNVGVGIASPTAKLYILESSVAQAALAISHGTNSDVLSITKSAGSGNLLTAIFTNAQGQGISFTNTDASTFLMNAPVFGFKSTVSVGTDNQNIYAGQFSATQSRSAAGSNSDLVFGVDATAASSIATAGVWGYAVRATAGSSNIIPLAGYGVNASASAVSTVQLLANTISGTPAAGFGARLQFALKSSTTLGQSAADIEASWITATDASRASSLALNVYFTSTAQEGVRVTGDTGGVKLGFYGVTPTARQVLATGAGATVDNVISLLQTLGLCKQS